MVLLKNRLAYFFAGNGLTFRHKVGNWIVMKDELGLEEIILPTMANKTITMLQLRKLLQLKEQGYSNRRIKGMMNLSWQTVDDYVKRLKQTDKSYKELLKLDNDSLQVLAIQDLALPVLNDKFADFQSRLPGFAEDLKNRKTTRIILWEEYREQVHEGYGRSRFCEHLCRYQESRKAVMHFDHSPAELLEFFSVMLPSICICGTCVDCFDITAIFISKNIIYKKSLSCLFGGVFLLFLRCGYARGDTFGQ